MTILLCDGLQPWAAGWNVTESIRGRLGLWNWGRPGVRLLATAGIPDARPHTQYDYSQYQGERAVLMANGGFWRLDQLVRS